MQKRRFNYLALYKPYGHLSQFTDRMNRKTLSDFNISAKDVYPIGRLDMDSEGLLLLSNDKSLVDFLLNPKNKHEREYLAQVEGIPTETEMNQFKRGLLIENKMTMPAKIEIADRVAIHASVPPIRKRLVIPTCWLKIILTEGRNRQVRRMTAAIGHPTLRLIRVRIKNIRLDNLKPGGIRELNPLEINQLWE